MLKFTKNRLLKMEKLNLNNIVAFGLIVIQNFTLNSMFIYFILALQTP